ncbi:MAG: oxidoreductase [Candidatus Angelobacter sp. Gp1-AA117]|nr:MAG: oxidoreductase [Candidatus Angelobacter sp. Gp1-AA117]
MEQTRPYTALLLGASGLVGGSCLRRLLEEEQYEKVISLGRRELPVTHPKLTQHRIAFESLETLDLPPMDDVFCALGTTIRKAGSQAAFRRVDLDFTVAAARLGLKHGAQQFVLVSSIGADPESGNFYLRTKGEVEKAIMDLSYPALHIFRPSLLVGDRKESRVGERIAIYASKVLEYMLVGGLRKYRPVNAATVADAMMAAGKSGNTGVHTYEFDEIKHLTTI